MNTATPPDHARALSPGQRLRRVLGRLIFAFALTLFIIFTLSRLITDRWYPAQFAFWVPAWIYITVITVLIAAERGLSPPPSSRLRSPSWWMLLGCAAAAVLFAWEAIPRKGAPAVGPGLTVVHWNMSSPDMRDFPGTFADFPSCAAADVLVLGATVPESQLRHMVSALGPDWTVRQTGVFAVASRHCIRTLKAHALNLDQSVPRQEESPFQTFYNDTFADRFGVSRREFDLVDPGFVLEFALEVEGATRVIRLIDLPSSPLRGRMDIARAAVARIAGLTDAGALVREPDIMVGDCNIPRGSASLALLAGDLRDARSAARSRSAGATWPRALPLLTIDHAWVNPACEVADYHTFDAGISDHRGQSLRVEFSAAAARAMHLWVSPAHPAPTPRP